MVAPEPLDPALIGALKDPSSYPGDASAALGVDHLQTHISHVFLTRDWVYKLRKAVRFSFVDFSTVVLRRADARNEVALNRRLAADVYAGVARVQTRKTGRVSIGPALEPCDVLDAGAEELATVMRRLPEGGDALSRISRDELDTPEIDEIAERLARFHDSASLGRPAPWSAYEWRTRTRRAFWDTLDLLCESLQGEGLASARELVARVRRFEDRYTERFERRRRDGKAVDGHGDLHLDHLWFDVDGVPRIIDCLEFRDDLRQIDAAADVAFLSMDLRYRGRGDLAERFLARYAEASDDFSLFGVLPYFESYRAAVRAKVAELAASDPAIPSAQRTAARESCRRHLALAVRVLAPPIPGALILTSGWVGTGKSSIARHLATHLPALHLASDRVRKRLAGVDPSESLATPSADWSSGAYSAAAREEVYRALCERAEAALAAGRNVILDATFASRDTRDSVRHWAEERGLSPWLIQAVAPDAVTLERLRKRRAAATDPSDAGPDLLAPSRLAFEPPDEWPRERRTQIHTDARDWSRALDAFASRIRESVFG